ncbi:MAG: pyridoxamine 5'-phosphate oxidase family protein [Nitrososphaeraceae archaeon]|nr:pyridoxamine 5'-phosphate oxidase family protein [Nitrososphaeraceae archaeon]
MFISKDDILYTLKLIQAIPGMPNTVTETEVNNFLESRLNMQIATIDEEGYPMIQPTWFLYDNKESKIYTATQKMAKKVQNIRRNPDKIYFSIDDENHPYKGVKGRGIATISEEIQKNLPIVEKINIKYLGTLEHPLAKMILENTRSGTEVVIEITPRFFSAWDFGKAM